MQQPPGLPHHGPPTPSAATPSRKAPALPASQQPQRPPRPQDPPGEPLSPASGSNKPNVAASADGECLAAVPFAQAPSRAAQANDTTVKAVAPVAGVPKEEDELFQGGWMQCVMYLLGLLCMLVAVASVVILYLFLTKQQERVQDSRTAAWGQDESLPSGRNEQSLTPTSEEGFGVFGDNVTLTEESASEEPLYVGATGEAD
ncbi:hypothetical protein V5799_009119 [Amblyomma americanum]|uniref:Uncharacterized protein n=1 Tax=Amblyomma americanum TaxID=6943 RepID=A0AAQ4E6L6_AMBAM